MMASWDTRLAGAEALLRATVPWLDETALRDVRATLLAELIAAPDQEEQNACIQALRLLEDGIRRYPRFELGAWVADVAPTKPRCGKR